MSDLVSELRKFNRGREPERLAMKYERMNASPFAFLRGSCHLFYQKLPRSPVLRKAPLVWACGDLHLENLGSYRGDNGQVYFDINDFDEALRAPASWDLVRLLASVLVARKLFGANRSAARELCDHVLEMYTRALREGKPRWVERETAASPVRELLEHAAASHHDELLRSRTVRKRGQRMLKLDPRRALPASERAQEKVRALFAARQKDSPQLAHLEVVDVARRVAGTGSLGLERYVLLVEVKGHAEREQLLDLKVASPAAALEHGFKIAKQPRFADEAARIVAVQQRMQAITMASLRTVRMNGKPFVLRRLLPSEDRVDLEKLGKRGKVENLLRTVGECLAWDQQRSSGRDGSASADELIAWAQDGAWHRPLIELALTAAEEVERDYEVFQREYARGTRSG
jgi:uncharacterized protein (DUF2252 family)